LLISDSRRDDLWVDEDQYKVEWLEAEPDGPEVRESEEQVGGPVVVAKAYDGTYPTSVFAAFVPATKASCFGLGGHTHLVADKRDGVWAVRRLHRVEVERMFVLPEVEVVPAASDDDAVAEFGNSAPARVVLPRAEQVVAFCRPPSRYVPTKISDVVDEDTVKVCRGWMDLAAQDFRELSRAN
jgi:hypothetical protein